MDYGPFGFVEQYDRNWNMWIDGGDKFALRNQPTAGGMNFRSLAESVALLMDAEGKQLVQELVRTHFVKAEEEVLNTFCRKLGLRDSSAEVATLVRSIETLMENTQADFTLFWRQLSLLPEACLRDYQQGTLTIETILGILGDVFYHPLSEEDKSHWYAAFNIWFGLLSTEIAADVTSGEVEGDTLLVKAKAISVGMKLVSPKYVPREWMLFEAYHVSGASEEPDMQVLHKLKQLFEHPYDEQPEYEAEYYRKTPADYLNKAGIYCQS